MASVAPAPGGCEGASAPCADAHSAGKSAGKSAEHLAFGMSGPLKPMKSRKMVVMTDGGGMHTIDLTSIPLKTRESLAQLDLDSDGQLDVGEIASAVSLLRSSRALTKRLTWLVFALVVAILLLIAALFGTSYAAAVLAQKMRPSDHRSPALTDNSGTTLRTANAALPGAIFTPAGATLQGARRLHGSDELPAEIFSHRRTMSIVVDAGGRQLAVADDTGNDNVPAPLALVANLNAAVIPTICSYAAENHFAIAMPFDPYAEGIKTVIANFKPATMQGCGHLDTFGFAADFGVVFTTGAAETFWHIDCVGPVTPASTCSVSRVFLVPQAPDLTAAMSPDTTDVVSVPLSANETGPGARRLAPGAWPPPSITWNAAASNCPSLSSGTIPTKTGVGSEVDTSWKAAIMSQLNVDPTATPAEQAMLACQTSMLCLAGYAVGSGMIFKKDFWTSSAAMSVAMGTTIANNFQETMSPKNIRSAFDALGGRTRIKCTNYYSWATCSPNSLPVFVGVTGSGESARANYQCKTWNTADVRVGASEIAATCANSCEVLQWYMSWFQHYRVGSYSIAAGKPSWDSTSYKYVQDYCGTGSISTTSSALYGGKYSSYIFSTSTSFAEHSKCWKGGRIPMCQSFKILTHSTC